MSEIIVGLDIGTTKICAIVGKKNEHGKIEVLGFGKAPSLGVKRGTVQNIEQTVNAIKTAVAEASKKSTVDIKVVHVGIAGQHIKSLQSRGSIVRSDTGVEINQNDIDKLTEDMYKMQMEPGDKIIHVLPQDYIVDNEPGIKNPIGMAGVRLEANFHIITGHVNAIQNIFKCVQKAGLEIAGMYLEPLASAASALKDEEKEAGVALVDIGGGTTDIAIFHENIIRHTAVIPFGGDVITNDIKEGCTIMFNLAEKLKVQHGCALANETLDNEIVSITPLPGRDPKEISIRNLAHIIQARMEEIMEHIYYEIKMSGFEKKLIGGIVITGGGSQLKHLKQLVEYTTGMDTRVGYPNEHLASEKFEEIKNPLFATGIGLILKGFEDLEIKRRKFPEEKVKDEKIKKEPFWKTWFEKSKEILEEEEDKDLN